MNKTNKTLWFRKSTWVLGVLFCFVLIFASLSFSNGVQAEEECIELKTRTSQGPTGHNHLVRLTNRCDQSMRCKVTTNANPKGVNVNVPAKGSIEVNTFLNSPASSFQAKAECTP